MNLSLTPVRFKQHAARVYGDKIGVVCGDQRFTYKQYSDRANQLSHALRQLGVSPGDRVAFLSYNCHRLLEAYYGVVQIGAVLLPLNIRLKPGELTYILNDSGTTVLFFEPELTNLTQEIASGAKTIKNYIALSGNPPSWAESKNYDSFIADAPTTEPDFDIDENSLAELFYTSGTTANPKGVMLSHRNLYMHAMNVMAGLQFEDDLVQLHTIPLFHVNGWGTPQYVTCQGGKHVMLQKFDPVQIFELTQQERVSRISVVPTMATALVNCPEISKYDLSSMRLVNIGGAACPVELIKQVEEKTGALCFAGYGLSETSPVLTLSLPKREMNLSEEARFRLQAMTGRPLPGVEIRIVDGDNKDVPADGATPG